MKRISQGGAPSHEPSATLPQSAAPVMNHTFFDDSTPSQSAVSAPLASCGCRLTSFEPLAPAAREIRE